jgi:pilus assembly protein CpaC
MTGPSARRAPWLRWALASVVLAAGSPLLASDTDQHQRPADQSTVLAVPSAVALSLGQTRLFDLDKGISRLVIADDTVADFRLLTPNQFYLLGKSVGRTNLMVWQRGEVLRNVVIDVGIDVSALAASIKAALPHETAIEVRSSAASIVLDGLVDDAVAADTAMRLARAHALNLERQLRATAGPGAQMANRDVVEIVNLLRMRDPQQVMLEVRIAEVSRSLADKLGVGVNATGGNNRDFRWSLGSDFVGVGSGGVGLALGSELRQFTIDLAAEEKRGLIKILAEPTLVAMSGMDASFNVGGRIFIPVLQQAGPGGAGAGITLEEREFGVGLKFRPTVLDKGRISLMVVPEVSEISRESIAVGNASNPTFLPALTVSRVSTTVQLAVGQNLVIGGLLRNTSFTTVKRFPLLGSLPILGALFRSTEYANEKTELIVLVKPTLVAGTAAAPRLPTDAIQDPTTSARLLEGKLEKAKQP